MIILKKNTMHLYQMNNLDSINEIKKKKVLYKLN